MQVRTVTVSASRKMPHPTTEFASYSSLVSLEAALDEADNPAAAVKKLQAQVDNLVEQVMESTAARLRQQASSAKAQNATATKADGLAAKHGGR